MSDTTAELLQRYRELAALRAGVDYTSPASARATDALVEKMRAVAAQIGAEGEEAVNEFGGLLDEERDGISVWAALHLLELMNPSESLARSAFRVIEERAAGDDLEAFGCRMRLQELRKR